MPTPSVPAEIKKAVVEKAIAGIRPLVIFTEIKQKASLSHIYHIISEARAAGHDIPHFQTGKLPDYPNPISKKAVTLGPSLLERLSPAAAKRGISPSQLAGRIMRAVVDHNLIDAVLDDGVEP